MASLLADYKIILILKKLSKFSRFFITFSILFFSLISWSFFFLLPIYRTISEENFIKKNLLNKINLFQKSLNNFKKIKQESVNLEKHSKNIFKKSSFQNFINDFLNFVNKNEIVCFGMNPVKIKKKDFYKKEYFNLNLTGKFSRIYSFLEDLHKCTQNLKFKNIEFYKDLTGDVLLNLKLRVVTF
ncbi:type 4a pilus biogenesis protein PilO [Candidatus Babeliales bacterium]|nr:type 4a pilus biogenesis protein PilO [Candidatus Babeliales bacterium]